ncbi:MAG: hypothetical protein ACK5OS_00975 [Chryseotalea sp.]
MEPIYLKGLHKIKELPKDDKYRILYFFGEIKLTEFKNDPRIKVAFAKYDPYKDPSKGSTFFGTKGFFYNYITKEEYHQGIFEYYYLSVELLPFLKVGSIWHVQTEIAFIIIQSENHIKGHVGLEVETFQDLNLSIINAQSNQDKGVLWLEIPKKISEHYVLKIPLKRNVDNHNRQEYLLIPLIEICRKFYFLSSRCIHGLLSGYFIKNQSELFMPYVNTDEEEANKKSVNVKFLNSHLGTNEAIIAAFILYSEKVKDYLKLINTSLQASLYNDSGYITRTNLPYVTGTIGITYRGKKVKLNNNVDAYYVFEILNCEGETPFSEISTFFESKELKENPNDGTHIPPLIKFKSSPEYELDLINFTDVQDSNYSIIDVKYNDDNKSGYIGIKVNRKKRLKSESSNHLNVVFSDDDITSITTGIGDKVVGSEVPGVQLFNDEKFRLDSSFRNPYRFVEIDCLNILKSALDNILLLIKNYLENNEVSNDAQYQSSSVSTLIKDCYAKTKGKVYVKYFRFGSIYPKSEYETFVISNLESRWSIKEDSTGKKRLRKAVVACIELFNENFLIIEFEKFKYDISRLIVIKANKDFEFSNEELVKNIFKACCECEASYSNLHKNNLINTFKVNFLNHKYDYGVEYLSRRILEIIN